MPDCIIRHDLMKSFISGVCFIEDDLKKSARNTKDSRTQQGSRRSRVRNFSSSDEEYPTDKLQSASKKKSVKLYTGVIQVCFFSC